MSSHHPLLGFHLRGPRRSRPPKSKRPGTAPGTLEPPAEQRVETIRIEVFEYGPESLRESADPTEEELIALRDATTVSWINVVGLHDVGLLSTLGEIFGLHPLALEDVLHPGQRPKLEEYETNLFCVLRHLELHEEGLGEEQIAIFITETCVLTFQEVPGDPFDAVRERIRREGSRLRQAGPDYLAYALIDALVDSFFPLLERFGERIEALEDEVVENAEPDTLARIHGIKRELLGLRRATWPQREVLLALARQEPPLMRESTKVYLRDCYDHTVQIMDFTETYRDLASGLLDVYLSSLSHRMNEVMKTLTIMASLFIPLTFIAGVYGMNFQHMPELGWKWGYPAVWGIMIVVALSLLEYFRRKDWL